MIRKKTLSKAFCFLLLSLSVFCGFSLEGRAESAPKKEEDVIYFGYAQVKDYGSFAQVLLDIARNLVEEGSIQESFLAKYENADFEADLKDGDTRKLWNDICDANVEGARYRFRREAFFDMNEMEEADYPEMANRDDVDITFAMGTAPGVYLAENEKKNRFMCIYAADPVASGIVDPHNRNDHAFATLDLTSYGRQLDVGYRFLHFKKLGVVYEDSEDAYAYSAISFVEEKSREHGFEVVYEHVKEPVSDDDYERYYKELKEAYRKLADAGIDCLYVTICSIDYDSRMQELLDDCIIPAGIKTLAQDDFAPLAGGALFGVTLSDAGETADHVVRQIKNFAEEGTPFRELDMVCEATPKIGINVTTADRIGFALSFEDLQMVDKVFRSGK